MSLRTLVCLPACTHIIAGHHVNRFDQQVVLLGDNHSGAALHDRFGFDHMVCYLGLLKGGGDWKEHRASEHGRSRRASIRTSDAGVPAR